jgi:hypothetical protein
MKEHAMSRTLGWAGLAAGLLVLTPAAGHAQTLGTFRWQLQPYCNVVTLAVTAVNGAFRLEGTDDQCGGATDKASAIGTAFQNPDGTIGFGLTIVATPGGRPVHVDAALPPGQFTGTWRDSAGASGAFVLTPGAGAGGSPRPLSSSETQEVPPSIGLRPDGGLVATGTPNAPIPASGDGDRLMWHAGKAALRAGRAEDDSWDDGYVGLYTAAFGRATMAEGLGAIATGDGARARGHASAALGRYAYAEGQFSLAAGNETHAQGLSSFAIGQQARAEGIASAAIGEGVVASGAGSVAFGLGSTASGLGSVASGYRTAASGFNSAAFGDQTSSVGWGSLTSGVNNVVNGRAAVALGENVVATGASSIAMGYAVRTAAPHGVAIGANAGTTEAGRGSIVLGDGALVSGAGLVSTAPNEFKARASGGVYLYTNPGLSAGVQVAPGGSAWLMLSDARSKENFRDLDGEDVLSRIATMPVREWNYRAQSDSIRHVGPTAQDFHAAFGLGEDPLRIGTGDADGIALAAVQALELRTRVLADENAALLERVRRLESDAAAVAPAALRVDEADEGRRGASDAPAASGTRVPEAFEWIAAVLACLAAGLAYLLRAAGPFV